MKLTFTIDKELFNALGSKLKGRQSLIREILRKHFGIDSKETLEGIEKELFEEPQKELNKAFSDFVKSDIAVKKEMTKIVKRIDGFFGEDIGTGTKQE